MSRTQIYSRGRARRRWYNYTPRRQMILFVTLHEEHDYRPIGHPLVRTNIINQCIHFFARTYLPIPVNRPLIESAFTGLVNANILHARRYLGITIYETTARRTNRLRAERRANRGRNAGPARRRLRNRNTNRN